MDITEATGFLEKRIPASKISLEIFDRYINEFIELIRNHKNRMIKDKKFKEWGFDDRYTARPHLKAGRISVDSDAVFRYHRNVLNCFGYNEGHHQSGGWSTPFHIGEAMGLLGKYVVWFPKLYGSSDRRNGLIDDGNKTIERNIKDDEGYIERWDRQIVMAYSRDELSRTLYRSLEVSEVIPGHHTGNIPEFHRVSTSVNVYPSNDAAS